ncbi:thromboxane-A synthase [Pelobates cultripes]|uniref:Thromboxane-A synthase n=1 Tax=Pelobates cultripes TaxID=61616 RepID=A0AAD1RR38_PELCU|nr:thromboxane-A synthase [Pelobates cultripes]
MGRRPIVLLSEPEAIKQVLQKDFSNFTNRMKLNLVTKPMSDSLLCLRDEKWKRVRSVLTPSFSAVRMKEMCPLINQGCDVLVTNLQKYAETGDPCPVQRNYACFTMDVVVSVAFGTKVDSQKDPDHPLVQNSKKFMELFTPFKPLVLLSLAFPSIMIPIARRIPNKKRDQINSFFLKVIRDIIAQRDDQPANERRRDFLQLMLDARDSFSNITVEHFDIVNQADLSAPRVDHQEARMANADSPKKTTKTLNEEEILGQAFLFLIAGYETTCSLLSFATYLLAIHPECQDKVLREVDEFSEKHVLADYNTVNELPYLDMVISETLRMYPPAFRFAREASRDCTVMGYKIPAGTVLEVPIGCLHNDPKFWSEPEKFQPERFTVEEKQKRNPFVYLPFGAGPRSCIGMRLAILETKITLFRVLQKFRFDTCPLTQIPLQISTLSTLRPKDGVYVKLVAR